MTNLILGIDIGTASTKAIAFNAEGVEVAAASRPYPLLTPQPGWVEQDADEVWRALLDVLREIVAKTGTVGDRPEQQKTAVAGLLTEPRPATASSRWRWLRRPARSSPPTRPATRCIR